VHRANLSRFAQSVALTSSVGKRGTSRCSVANGSESNLREASPLASLGANGSESLGTEAQRAKVANRRSQLFLEDSVSAILDALGRTCTSWM
jgi:hypothetical protein